MRYIILLGLIIFTGCGSGEKLLCLYCDEAGDCKIAEAICNNNTCMCEKPEVVGYESLGRVAQ